MKLKYIPVVVLGLITASCSKELNVKDVNFNAAAVAAGTGAAADSFSIANGGVAFNLSGNPDYISFYSGEIGHRYEFRDRTTAAGIPKLQFSSALNTSGNGTLSLMLSSDFKGLINKVAYGVSTIDTGATMSNINKATWADITGRATWATGTTAVSSGSIDLSDFVKSGPVYVAFRYQAPSGNVQKKWTITALSVTNNLTDEGSSYVVANLNNATTAFTNYGNSSYSPGWAPVFDSTVNANKYAWVFTSASSLVITGAATAAAATANADAWVVMGPVDLTKVTPDVGVGIKTLGGATLANYPYASYAKGLYNAVFVGANGSASTTKSNVVKVPVKIVP
jgi:hypothetical protein